MESLIHNEQWTAKYIKKKSIHSSSTTMTLSMETWKRQQLFLKAPICGQMFINDIRLHFSFRL